MKHLWRRGDWRLEVLKPQVDDSGYDPVLEANSVVRHVQLKSSFCWSTVDKVNVNVLLASKRSGCAIFMWFDQDSLDLGPFAFFGGPPGQPLPDLAGMKIGKHTKANAEGFKAERPNIRTVPLSKFDRLNTVEQIVGRLFGNPLLSRRWG